MQTTHIWADVALKRWSQQTDNDSILSDVR